MMFRDSSSAELPPEVATTEAALEITLTQDAGRYSGIFLNPRLSEPHGVPLMKFIRTGDGFPNHLKAGRINLVAEIIGISEEFNDVLKRAAQNPELNPRLEMEKNLDRFSSSVVSTFRLFFANKF